MVAGTGLITLAEAQDRLPGRPSIRWLREEAKRLGCYRKIGQKACIPYEAWPSFEKGEQWREIETESRCASKPRVKDAKSTTRGIKYLGGKKAAKSSGDALSAALEFVTQKKQELSRKRCGLLK